MPVKNKAERTSRDRKILAGVGEHLGKKETLILNGVSYTANVIATVFEKDLVASDTTDKLRAQLRTAVEEQNRVNTEADGLVAVLKSYLALKYGEASATYSDFGFLPKKVTVKSSGAKALAAEKLRATRAARHTMGARQKSVIHGEVHAASNTSTAPLTPATGSALSNGAPQTNGSMFQKPST